MKKAKIMLTVVAALAIVGGTLAFKANRFSLTTYYTTTTPGDGALCPNAGPTNLHFTTVGGNIAIASITTKAPDAQNPDGYPCADLLTKAE